MSENSGRRRALRAFGRGLSLRASIRGDCALLDVALTHESYAYERAAGAAARALSNERLEFLGDAVLGLIVAADVYRRFPAEPEGKLAPRRAALVSRAALAETARRLGLSDLLRLGRGEEKAQGALRASILAAAYEAVLGAIFLSEGFKAAASFVARTHLAASPREPSIDPKTALQELAQGRFGVTPAYAVTAESGPPHARTFSVTVSVGDEVLGSGSGPTKKQAQTTAAAEALRQLGQS